MRLTHLRVYQGLCGLVVALTLATLPLPALADETSTTSATNDSTQSTPAETPVPQPLLTNIITDTPLPDLGASVETVSVPVISLPATEPSATSSTPAPTANLGIDTSVSSDATSGSATVVGNEQAGNATSGNAAAGATVLNVANANGLTAGDFTTFQCDINGDFQGNLIIDPTSLLPICSTSHVGSTQQPNTSQNLQTGASLVDILNNIVLTATSGDATVDGNETAGDATTGDAAALANIVNIANSAIGAKNSFLGVINIFGNLKGDILVPQSLVDSLMSPTGASGIPAGNTTISNNLDASAVSGDATVSDNEAAGDATSGDATTSMLVLNLTGQEVVAKNSLLVFINVLGKWMSLILPAPRTSTTAMYGGGVQNGSAGSINSLGGAGETTTNITNNVTVKAQSGDASVTDNETAGSATSGNAGAGVNLLNITNSNFVLEDWFGALFINVLGTWLGDFDIQEAALPAPAEPDQPAQPIKAVQVYQFTETTTVAPAASATAPSHSSNRNGSDVSTISAPTGKVLSTSNNHAQFVDGDRATKAVKLDILALGAIIMALTLLIATGTMILRRWHTA